MKTTLELGSNASTKLFEFADDSKMLAVSNSGGAGPALQHSIDAVGEWARQSLLTFDSPKCCSLHLGKGSPKHVCALNGIAIQQVVQPRDLEVVNMRASNHLHSAPQFLCRIT
eukprot:GHVN01088654.1.p1 GENE.GHVN01088654.1~~GHVN01088654.1.p1  ORF type:complete len:113 (+),score=15.00 GHVN01088654.1:444-782(+)